MSLFRIFPKSVEQKYEEKITIVSNLVFVKCVFFFNFVLPFFFFFYSVDRITHEDDAR